MLEWDTFRVGSHVDDTEFSLEDTDEDACTKQFDIGDFSCLYAVMHFRRNTAAYLLKRFIPSTIVVLITFISFWIPTTQAPARISLPITCMLALITQEINSGLSVSYMYALQVWNFVCIIFVFANLLEFAVAYFEHNMAEKRRARKQQQRTQSDLEKCDGEKKPQQKTLSRTRKWFQRVKRHKIVGRPFRTTRRHSILDRISRYVFPLAFAIFVITFSVSVRSTRGAH